MAAIVQIIDERRESSDPRRLIATFENVPDTWTVQEIAKRYGIGEHFAIRVTREYPHGRDQVSYRHPQ
jgi:transposase